MLKRLDITRDQQDLALRDLIPFIGSRIEFMMCSSANGVYTGDGPDGCKRVSGFRPSPCAKSKVIALYE